MMKIEFATENAAFCDPYTGELDDQAEGSESIRILSKIIGEISCGYRSGYVHDLNGNRIGWWKFE